MIRKIPLSLSKSLILLPLLLLGCQEPPIPKWDGRIWIGDSKSQAMVHRPGSDQTKWESIGASAPRFDQVYGFEAADLQSWIATYVYGCEKWRDGVQMTTPSVLWKTMGLGPTPSPNPSPVPNP